MRILGEACLLIAFVGSGFAAFACLAGAAGGNRPVRRAGHGAAGGSVLALTIAVAVLAAALIRKDFSFAYVAQYSSRLLPWQYSLSALWVGQAGSLLLWAWLLGLLALLFRWWPQRAARGNGPPSAETGLRRDASLPDAAAWTLREPALGILLAYLCFLCAVMIFAADPLEASRWPVQEGRGLSPLLQHPAMLFHPPVVFLGYTLWTVPFALAAVALASERASDAWIELARPWALAAWSVLGVGILLGADWAYEELGWGGYWSWDPVENGSLLPWLTGTALIHGLMAWQHRRMLKKTTVGLAIATFALCNLATFLTRSGVFGSLHAFSRSAIGWLFLILMIGITAAGLAAVVWRRRRLSPEQPLRSATSREALVVLGILALLLLAAATLAGTLSTAASSLLFGRAVMVGPEFYNGVLRPLGLTLLLLAAAAPLVRWGRGPSLAQRRALLTSVGVAGCVLAIAVWAGMRHPLALAVVSLAALAAAAFVGAVWIDAGGRRPLDARRGEAVKKLGQAPLRSPVFQGFRRFRSEPVPFLHSLGLGRTLRSGRRQYAGLLIHLGLMALALGVTGSSLGKREQEIQITAGQAVPWAGRDIRLARIVQRELPDKLVAEAVLEISRGQRREATLVPAQHYHKLSQEWTAEVARHSTWRGDFQTILHGGTPDGQLSLTLIETPWMRWLWLGGWIMVLGTCIRLFPRWAAIRAGGGRRAEAVRQARPAVWRRRAPSRWTAGAVRGEG